MVYYLNEKCQYPNESLLVCVICQGLLWDWSCLISVNPREETECTIINFASNNKSGDLSGQAQEQGCSSAASGGEMCEAAT